MYTHTHARYIHNSTAIWTCWSHTFFVFWMNLSLSLSPCVFLKWSARATCMPMIKLQRWEMKRRNVKHIVVKLFESNSCSWPYSIRSFSSFDRFYFFFPLFYCIYFIIMNTTRHGVDGCGDVAVSILDVCCFFLFFFALWLWQSHWTCTLYTLHLVSCLFASLSLLLTFLLGIPCFGPFKFMWFLRILCMLIKIFLHIFFRLWAYLSSLFSKHHLKKPKKNTRREEKSTIKQQQHSK